MEIILPVFSCNYFEQLFPCHPFRSYYPSKIWKILSRICAKFFNIWLSQGEMLSYEVSAPKSLDSSLLSLQVCCMHTFSVPTSLLIELSRKIIVRVHVLICSCLNTHWRCAACWCFWYKSSGRISLASYWWSRSLSTTEYIFLMYMHVPKFWLSSKVFAWTKLIWISSTLHEFRKEKNVLCIFCY